MLSFRTMEELPSMRTGRVHEITLKEGRSTRMQEEAAEEFGEAAPFFPTETGVLPYFIYFDTEICPFTHTYILANLFMYDRFI